MFVVEIACNAASAPFASTIVTRQGRGPPESESVTRTERGSHFQTFHAIHPVNWTSLEARKFKVKFEKAGISFQWKEFGAVLLARTPRQLELLHRDGHHESKYDKGHGPNRCAGRSAVRFEDGRW